MSGRRGGAGEGGGRYPMRGGSGRGGDGGRGRGGRGGGGAPQAQGGYHHYGESSGGGYRGGRGGGGRDGGRGGGGFPRGGGARGAGRGPGGGSDVAAVAPASAYKLGLVDRVPTGLPPGFEQAEHEELLEGAPATATTKLTTRPGIGKQGERTKVYANHFMVNFSKDAADFCLMYDVDIQPARGQGGAGDPPQSGQSSRALRPLPAAKSRELIRKVSERERWPVGWCYDGRKAIFAPGRFLPGGPQQDKTFDINLGDDDPFTIRVRKVAVFSLNALRQWTQDGRGEIPATSLRMIDVVLRHRVSMIPDTQNLTRACFVSHPSVMSPLGGGADVWLGYQQGARPCQRGISVVVNQAASAFVHAGPVMDLIMEATRLNDGQLRQFGIGMTGREYQSMKKAVTGIKVEATHNEGKRRQYRVNGVASESAESDMFVHETLGRISIAQYFSSQYGINLKYPKLPCLKVGSKGNRIPPEVCNIVPGLRVRKLSANQTQNMIRIAASPPAEKKAAIETLVANLNFAHDPQPAAYGIQVDTRMAEVDARILPAPMLTYNNPKEKQVEGGSWNVINCRFFKPGKINCWSVVCFLPKEEAGREMDNFLHTLTSKMDEVGITWSSEAAKRPASISYCRKPYPDRMQEAVLQEVNSAATNARQRTGMPPNLLLCILPTKDTDLYRAIKRAGDVSVGIVSQCLVASNAGITRPAKGLEQYCANVALKINHKLRGINVVLRHGMPHLATANKPYMFIGADVTHPTGNIKGSLPSIAGIVGSLDAFAGRYATRIQLQQSREEIIVGLDQAVAELLMEFYQATGGKKPEKIVFFRDGVSEGQFAHCLEQELPRLRKAFQDVSSGDEYQPLVTFVIVQKRHQTRLFPKAGGGDRKGNIKPGTVVDTGICHPHEFDFFLNSHEGIQGTVRPAHYHVLLDENNFSADGLQMLTHHMSYLFCRCTRSVSVCPPAYYAHLAAERGRALCSSYDSDSDVESISSSATGGRRSTETLDLHQTIKSEMFFV